MFPCRILSESRGGLYSHDAVVGGRGEVIKVTVKWSTLLKVLKYIHGAIFITLHYKMPECKSSACHFDYLWTISMLGQKRGKLMTP